MSGRGTPRWILWMVGLVALSGLAGCLPGPALPPDQPVPPSPTASPQVVAAYHLVEEGRQQLVRGEAESAVATFQKALALAPSSPHANLALGEAKLRQAEYRSALVYFDRVALLVGEDPDWRVRLALLRGEAYGGMGDSTRARAAYQDVLRLDPRNREAVEGLARLPGGVDIP